MNIAVISGTTRQGRVTPRLAKWVMAAAEKHITSDFTLLDLSEYDIPMLEQAPWQEGRKVAAGTQRWLDGLAKADGVIIVTAEYNHTIPAVLKNAFDQTNGEMKRKPVAIVSHGVNSGVRANEHLRQMVNSNMDGFPISATVTFAGNVEKALDQHGIPTEDNKMNDTKIDALLRDIIWFTDAIKRAKDRDAG